MSTRVDRTATLPRLALVALSVIACAAFISCGDDKTPTSPSGKVPSTPTGLQIVALSSTSTQLTWQDESANEDGFRIYRGPASDDISTLVHTTSANEVAATDSGLNPETTYHYKLCGYNSSGRSEYVYGSVTTPPAVGSPSIALSRTNLDFNANVGGGNPASQTVSITNGGEGTLSGLSATVSYGTGNGWLFVNSSSTAAPSTLTVHPNTGSLVAGTYTATINVSSPVAGNSPQSIMVTFTVSAPSVPSILLSTSTLSFAATMGGNNPASKAVTITNGGGGTLSGLSATVSYSAGSGWLSTSLNSTTAPSTLTVQPNTGSLASGTYTATIHVSSPVAGNSPQSIMVTFTVSAPSVPSILLSTSTLSFTATMGGNDPASKALTITNGGGGTLSGLSATVSYSTGSGWLSASLSSTTAPSTLTVQPNTGSLASGTYTATIDVASASASNSPRSITVTFTVSAGPLITLSTSNLSFTAAAGGSDPAAQMVSITNGGGGSLTELARGFPLGTPTWLTAELSGTTAPATLTVRAHLMGPFGPLPAGTYTTTIAVTSPAASNSPRNISVTYTITSAPRRLRIINNSTSGLFLDDIAQMKIVAPASAFTTADLLAQDGQCWNLPQSVISVSQSLTFDVTASDYKVFIGMGTWECDATGLVCPLSFCWWKRTYTTDVNFNNYWVWVAVDVTDHQSGTWDWILSGSYTSGALRVTPAGDAPIYFNVTNYNPIAGARMSAEDDGTSSFETVIPRSNSSRSLGREAVLPKVRRGGER